MNPSILPLVGLVLVLLLRPWRYHDESSREFSALIAACLCGIVFLSLCRPI